MQFPFSVIVSMHTIFGIFVTPFHSNNVMLIRFSLSVSVLTFLIMNFTILVQIVKSAMGLAIAFFPQQNPQLKIGMKCVLELGNGIIILHDRD